MYLVVKGFRQIRVATKEDANNVTFVLNELDCPDSLYKKQIIGGNTQGEQFKVSFMEKDVTIIGRESVEELLSWLLALGTKKVAIERAAS